MLPAGAHSIACFSVDTSTERHWQGCLQADTQRLKPGAPGQVTILRLLGKGLTFPVAYGATKEDADRLGSWWTDDHDGTIQPSEFLLGRGGTVLGALYASGPVGRMSADEAIRLIQNRERRRLEQEQQGAR